MLLMSHDLISRKTVGALLLVTLLSCATQALCRVWCYGVLVSQEPSQGHEACLLRRTEEVVQRWKDGPFDCVR